MTKHLYLYDGPVTSFGRIINYGWKAKTWAVSEAKAKSNFAYQYKVQSPNHSPGSKIELPGKIIQIN